MDCGTLEAWQPLGHGMPKKNLCPKRTSALCITSPKASIIEHFLGTSLCPRSQGLRHCCGPNVTVLETKAFYAGTIHQRHKTVARPNGPRGIDSKLFENEEEQGGHDKDQSTNHDKSSSSRASLVLTTFLRQVGLHMPYSSNYTFPPWS